MDVGANESSTGLSYCSIAAVAGIYIYIYKDIYIYI